ncbi:MAG: CPBP family intramembrane metalloprotease [Chloroflexi bacterium]|nr:CPBP family intramembrane metalloprotease [Chloroflexota bacterium]
MGVFEIGLVAGVIVAANFVVKSGNAQYGRLFDLLLGLFNIPLFLIGLLMVLLPDTFLLNLQEAGFPFEDLTGLGISFQVMAVWGGVFSFRSTRESVSRFIPINPDSAVHTLALVLSGYLAVGTVAQLSLGGLEQLLETAVSVNIWLFLGQNIAFVVVALLGVGLAIRRTPTQAKARLGLQLPTLRQLAIGSGWIVLLLIIQTIAGGLWQLTNPEQLALVESLNEVLYTALDSPWDWLLLALAAGIGEEILFRGALQPVLGLWLTAILFAVVHVQYGFFTPATVALLLIGLGLGVIRQRYNTTTAVFVHIGYDLVLGLAAWAAAAVG